MVKCDLCGSEEDLPFICRYCGRPFCVEHRLPEAHRCSNLFQAKPPDLKTETIRVSRPRYSLGASVDTLGSREMRDIIIAWATLSFCFSVRYLFNINRFVIYFGISLITLGLGFIIHELSHRSVARRLGILAEFRLWPLGLLMALIFALLSGGTFVFAAPGAVYIGPKISGFGGVTRRDSGVISLVGPLSNVLVAFGFLGLTFLPGILFEVGSLGFRINMWLAAFNLIPFGMFDGYKIFSWSSKIWAIIAIPVWIITVIPFLL